MTHTDESLTTGSFSPKQPSAMCNGHVAVETAGRKPYQAPVCQRLSLPQGTEFRPIGVWSDGGSPSLVMS